MDSNFWINIKNIMDTDKNAKKAIRKTSGVPRTTIHNGIIRKGEPKVSIAYKIAKSLGKSVEELHAGVEGKEYIEKLVKNDFNNINVPDYMEEHVNILKLLKYNEDILNQILKIMKALSPYSDEDKKTIPPATVV